jgi:hypothetical protein
MAVRNYFVCDGFETGTMYIYASSREVQTVWGDSRGRLRKAEMKQLSQAEPGNASASVIHA